MAKKTKSLPWIPLDENNHPNFVEEVLVWTNAGYKFLTTLTSKTSDNNGTKFVFGTKKEGDEIDNATHYLLITAPE